MSYDLKPTKLLFNALYLNFVQSWNEIMRIPTWREAFQGRILSGEGRIVMTVLNVPQWLTFQSKNVVSKVKRK
jgi:hypothetical protein